MPTVSLSTAKPTTARADALILGIRNDEDREEFATALELLGFTGEKDQVVAFPSNGAAKAELVVAVALPDEPDAEDLRRAAARGVRAAKNATSVAVALHPTGVDEVEAIAEGIHSAPTRTTPTSRRRRARAPRSRARS